MKGNNLTDGNELREGHELRVIASPARAGCALSLNSVESHDPTEGHWPVEVHELMRPASACEAARPDHELVEGHDMCGTDGAFRVRRVVSRRSKVCPVLSLIMKRERRKRFTRVRGIICERASW
jgi:hypothetical protein